MMAVDEPPMVIDRNTITITRAQADTELLLKEHEFDHYATSKSISQSMLNISSIQAQIVLLVSLFGHTRFLNQFEIATVALISASLCLQFTIFVLLVVL